MSELNEFIRQSIHELNKHVEEFAAAFIQKTGLDPTKVKMVTQIKGDLARVVWFEPFPTGSEIEMYRIRAEKTGCKHEVGKVYQNVAGYFYLVQDALKYRFVHINGDFIGKSEYNTLEEIDKRSPYDVEVDAELIIREVK